MHVPTIGILSPCVCGQLKTSLTAEARAANVRVFLSKIVENSEKIVKLIEHTYIIPLVSDQEEGIKIDSNPPKMAEEVVDDIFDN